MSNNSELANFIENMPLYIPIFVEGEKGSYSYFTLKEIQSDCEKCGTSKPFHNVDSGHILFEIKANINLTRNTVHFKCVTCMGGIRSFWLQALREDDNIIKVFKIGQYPQKELPKSKDLSKFFKDDKQEYNKAVICLANGYGVAAFAYMRRIVEKNIDRLLDMIKEDIDTESPLNVKIAELKATSPMSDKISIANHALPDHLNPDGFNPLGQIYGLLSDGVHSLPDEDCLNKANNLQACLEYLISELATHKQNKEDFKKRLNALRKA